MFTRHPFGISGIAGQRPKIAANLRDEGGAFHIRGWDGPEHADFEIGVVISVATRDRAAQHHSLHIWIGAIHSGNLAHDGKASLTELIHWAHSSTRSRL